MTGPKSMSTGASLCDSATRNFCSAFDGMTDSGPLGAGASPTPPGAGASGRLLPNLRRSEMDKRSGSRGSQGSGGSEVLEVLERFDLEPNRQNHREPRET